MTPSQIIKHYGSPKKVADALNITVDRVYRWRERGFVPARMQATIAGYTDQALKVSPPYENNGNAKKTAK